MPLPLAFAASIANAWAGDPAEDAGLVLAVLLVAGALTAAIYLRNSIIALFVKKKLVLLEIGKGGPFRTGDTVNFSLKFRDSGKPLQNATVFLASEEGGERALTTDRKGRASFSSDKESIYHVTLPGHLVHGDDRIIVGRRD